MLTGYNIPILSNFLGKLYFIVNHMSNKAKIHTKFPCVPFSYVVIIKKQM